MAAKKKSSQGNVLDDIRQARSDIQRGQQAVAELDRLERVVMDRQRAEAADAALARAVSETRATLASVAEDTARAAEMLAEAVRLVSEAAGLLGSHKRIFDAAKRLRQACVDRVRVDHEDQSGYNSDRLFTQSWNAAGGNDARFALSDEMRELVRFKAKSLQFYNVKHGAAQFLPGTLAGIRVRF